MLQATVSQGFRMPDKFKSEQWYNHSYFYHIQSQSRVTDVFSIHNFVTDCGNNPF